MACSVYSSLSFINSSDGAVLISGAAKKELTVIPALVFAMEDLEKELVKYSKQSKVNLLKGFKRSATRDFQIDIDSICEFACFNTSVFERDQPYTLKAQSNSPMSVL